jgi:methylated-DNA-[protein]-cysteine S-methyltransferase
MPAMPTTTLFQSHTDSPLGEVLLAATSKGLAGVWFVHQQAHMPDTQGWVTDTAHPTLLATAQQLKAYFEGRRNSFELSLQPAWGTPFQQSVWQALKAIPFGQTSTYGAIARAIGNPNAVRAVGAAVGQNPHSIVVPCHRVVGAHGALTGFAGGLDRKKYLLAHEATHA